MSIRVLYNKRITTYQLGSDTSRGREKFESASDAFQIESRQRRRRVHRDPCASIAHGADRAVHAQHLVAVRRALSDDEADRRSKTSYSLRRRTRDTNPSPRGAVLCLGLATCCTVYRTRYCNHKIYSRNCLLDR